VSIEILLYTLTKMQHINHYEPIFALATPAHRSALHLHRLSGLDILTKLHPYLRTKTKHLPINPIKYPHTQYVCLVDETETLIDDIVITIYQGPKSFTGEDLIEITSHGNPLISKKIHSFLRSLGFRDAREGEFTNRAFLNGKLDLSQAEAIRELIHAETYGAIKLSQKQLDGHLSTEIQSLREKFLNILSYFEAHIDFATDEVGEYEPHTALPVILEIIERLNILKSSYSDGLKLKEGVKIVLCGRPNSGKSTLYNTLLKSDRAIVTHIAGTTRDILRDHLVMENRDFILIDTAGLRQTKNLVESFGIQRTLQAIEHADIVCLLIDSSTKLTKKFFDSFHKINTKNFEKIIFVLSKSDLTNLEKLESLKTKLQTYFQMNEIVTICHNDISKLQNALLKKYDFIMSQTTLYSELSPILISARAHDKVLQALSILNETVVLVQTMDLPEKIASTLYCALKSIEEILGEVDMNHIYEKIFSTFCIGK
jgi:tRNA modification GTPase